mgnify:CR=1 FL=1
MYSKCCAIKVLCYKKRLENCKNQNCCLGPVNPYSYWPVSLSERNGLGKHCFKIPGSSSTPKNG